MRLAPALALAILLGAAVPVQANVSFFLGDDRLVATTLWMHFPDDSGQGYMNVRPPEGSALLIGQALDSAGCVAAVGLGPTTRPDTWVLGVSPDVIPLPQDENYNHYHWNPARMAFTLGPHLELTWYAGVSPGSALAAAGMASPPLQATLQAQLVVAHDEGGAAVIDQELAAGTSVAVAIGPAADPSTRTITVDGRTAYEFSVRLNTTDANVHSAPDSQLRLLVTLKVLDPACLVRGRPSTLGLEPFAATADDGRSLLMAAATPVQIERVDVVASAEGGTASALIESPWGSADVHARFVGTVGRTPLDDAQPILEPATHQDFHPLFNGTHRWSWGPTGPGGGIVEIYVERPDGGEQPGGYRQAYLNFDVPARGNVTCSMQNPADAVCGTDVPAQAMPALSPGLGVGALAAAALLLRRRSSP